jgi:hypothetical protein
LPPTVIRKLTEADLDHLKKALSLLGESEEDNRELVSVEAEALRALIAAYELVARMWREAIADYEFLEHKYIEAGPPSKAKPKAKRR